VQAFDKAFPMLLELRESIPDLEVMTILDLEDNIVIKSAGLFGDLCVDVSDRIAVYDNSEFSLEIGDKARAAGKLGYCGHFESSEHSRGKLRAFLPAVWRRISTRDPTLHWARRADALLGVYNDFERRSLAQDLIGAVKSNGGSVIGYFKTINDQGRGLSALENPSGRKPQISAKRTQHIDALLLPFASFRSFFKADNPVELATTGYPPFYRSWQRYVEMAVGPRRDSELNVVLLARGESAHRHLDDQIITEETLRYILNVVYNTIRERGQRFRLRVKPHPYQNCEALKQYINAWPEAELTFDPPAMLGANADVVIAVYSSAVLDGLVFGAALIEYCEENAAFRRLHSNHSPFGAFGVLIARTKEEFVVALRKALMANKIRNHPAIEEANALASTLPDIFLRACKRTIHSPP
jgi:hypothetical protein